MIQLTLSGTGGQGLIMAGIILAEAAMFDGKHVIQTQSYGPEARGGASKSDVIISSQEIDHPKVIKADVLMALSQASYDKYHKQLRSGGILIYDSVMVEKAADLPTIEQVALPFIDIARERFSADIFATIMALGALIKKTKVASEASLMQSLAKRVPAKTLTKNEQAVKIGLGLC